MSPTLVWRRPTMGQIAKRASSVGHWENEQKKLAGRFLSQRSPWREVPPSRHSQQCWSGAARHDLLPAKAPTLSSAARRPCGGQPSMPSLDSRCSTVCHGASWQMATSRRWDMLCPLLRALTKGGRAVVRQQGMDWQRRRWHWSLPAPLLAMPGVSQRVPQTPSDSLTFIFRFDVH